MFNIYIRFLLIFLNYLTFLFFLFYLYLYHSVSYLFSGDITHGFGSYLLVMHSCLAIIYKFYWYGYMMILLLFLFYIYYIVYITDSTLNTTPYNIWKNSLKLSSLFHYLYFIFYIVSLNGFFVTLLFLCTGIIWGDYSWGFPVSIEYRFVSLMFVLFLYAYTLVMFYSKTLYRFSYRQMYLYSLFIIFVFIFCFINYKAIFDVIGTSFVTSRIELHQSDQSLHFFLLSISGHYISIVFIFFCYFLLILLTLLFSIVLYLNTIRQDIYKDVFIFLV